MQFIRIFARLFTVQFDGEEKDAFEQIFEDWQNPEYLFEFFTEHEHDLQHGFYNATAMEAIRITKEEAGYFRDLIIKTKDEGYLIDANNINDLFIELSNSEYVFQNHRKQKAYGPNKTSWLRIYALKVQDCLLITGGAIKLTKKMDEREHTRKELVKLEKVKNELISLGIYDPDGLVE